MDQETATIAEYYYCHLTELVVGLRAILRQWLDYMEHYRVFRGDSSYHVPITLSTGRGRPKFEISPEQLVYLRSMCFTWRDIAKILGVSSMTIFEEGKSST